MPAETHQEHTQPNQGPHVPSLQPRLHLQTGHVPSHNVGAPEDKGYQVPALQREVLSQALYRACRANPRPEGQVQRWDLLHIRRRRQRHTQDNLGHGSPAVGHIRGL